LPIAGASRPAAYAAARADETHQAAHQERKTGGQKVNKRAILSE